MKRFGFVLVAAAFVKGVITAKGSVWVNGVEYDTAASTVHVDGVAASDANLKVGMTVALNVVIDPVTGKATAQTVNYESSVKGPVDTASVTTTGFSVFGQLVDVLSTTVFEGGRTGVTGATTPLVAGDFVEVSGQLDPATNHLVANRVEYKATPEDFEIKGSVASLGAGTLAVTLESDVTFTVGYTGTLDPAVAVGTLVRVKFLAANLTPPTTLSNVPAGQIEVRTTELHPDSGDSVEVEGVVAHYVAGSPATFSVDGQAIEAAASLIPSVTPAFGDGTRVEVEGTLSGTTLVAAKLHAKKAEADLLDAKGTVSAVDTTAGTFTVHPTAGADVVVAVDASTIFHDPAWFGADPLTKLVVNTDLVEVKYWVDSSAAPSVNRAVKVERQ
jgi:hypothetical protein